jgi:AcrR family transcriptional regulator
MAGYPDRVTGHAQRQRRRGEELEAALLDAAWEELLEAGFAKLTMESVAARARTGVAVLYRRWPGKDDLTMAAIAHYARAHPVAMPDTGSLRGDMLALLASFNDARNSFTVVTTATFAGLQASSGLTPAQVRARILGDRTQSAQIFLYAHERGEIDLDKTPPAVLTMPFDLMRHDLLMTLKPVSSDRITEIVDDLFMPLVAAYRPAPALCPAPVPRSVPVSARIRVREAGPPRAQSSSRTVRDVDSRLLSALVPRPVKGAAPR